jgi:hypothetical protein
MNFLDFSDTALEKETQNVVAFLKRGETRFLHLLAEIERRRLYSINYPSLFEYCTKFLKLSCGSAQRRIDAMRAMKLIPEIENKILSGELNYHPFQKHKPFSDKKKR